MKQLIIVFITIFLYLTSVAQSNVTVQGAMRNVMKLGQLEGTIFLDTISDKKNLYGLGPVAFLKGELLTMDGKAYRSYVKEDGSIQTIEDYKVKAPFFVYGQAKNWDVYSFSKSINTKKDIESFIDNLAATRKEPFIFKIEGTFDYVAFHIQNLPEGSVVKSPEDAHKGQGKYQRKLVKGEILGFFSRNHHSIFTHHDTNMHMHFINDNRTEMGHIDDIFINNENNNIKLFISK